MAEGREREDGFLLHYRLDMGEGEWSGLSIGPQANLCSGFDKILALLALRVRSEGF